MDDELREMYSWFDDVLDWDSLIYERPKTQDHKKSDGIKPQINNVKQMKIKKNKSRQNNKTARNQRRQNRKK